MIGGQRTHNAYRRQSSRKPRSSRRSNPWIDSRRHCGCLRAGLRGSAISVLAPWLCKMHRHAQGSGPQTARDARMRDEHEIARCTILGYTGYDWISEERRTCTRLCRTNTPISRNPMTEFRCKTTMKLHSSAGRLALLTVLAAQKATAQRLIASDRYFEESDEYQGGYRDAFWEAVGDSVCDLIAFVADSVGPQRAMEMYSDECRNGECLDDSPASDLTRRYADQPGG